VAALTPSREDIKTAYQGALQGSVPQAAAPAPAVPQAAVPQAQDSIRRLDASEIDTLLKRADALMASGDIIAARLMLQRAAEAGEGRAAMMLGGTYDPTLLDKQHIRGVAPDLAMARDWYEKARRFGAPEASSRLERLARMQN
jgi:TPR repeat protein